MLHSENAFHVPSVIQKAASVVVPLHHVTAFFGSEMPLLPQKVLQKYVLQFLIRIRRMARRSPDLLFFLVSVPRVGDVQICGIPRVWGAGE